MVATEHVDDETVQILEEERERLRWELRGHEIPIAQAAKSLRGRAERGDELKLALKRPETRIHVADTGNVVIHNDDDETLLVLTPEDASRLSSVLSLNAQLAETEECERCGDDVEHGHDLTIETSDSEEFDHRLCDSCLVEIRDLIEEDT